MPIRWSAPSRRSSPEDGRPTHLGTTIEQTCNHGLAWPARWWSFDGKTARFRFADGRVAGTMRLIENVTWSGGRYVCESGDVTFFAGAG